MGLQNSVNDAAVGMWGGGGIGGVASSQDYPPLWGLVVSWVGEAGAVGYGYMVCDTVRCWYKFCTCVTI